MSGQGKKKERAQGEVARTEKGGFQVGSGRKEQSRCRMGRKWVGGNGSLRGITQIKNPRYLEMSFGCWTVIVCPAMVLENSSYTPDFMSQFNQLTS